MANVLVVDDAFFMRMSINKILEANGHTMIGEAASGVEAIQYGAKDFVLKPFEASRLIAALEPVLSR